MLSPSALLERHPKESVRVVALEFLAQAEAARERLTDPHDTEALHDFRVAIRRLRSTIRAFRRELDDSVSKKSRARLRRIAQATNGGRDAEVQLEWLDAQRTSLYSRHRPGAAWFRDRLRRVKQHADATLHEEVTHDFARASATLRRTLPRYRLALRVGDAAPPPRFADALARELRANATELSLRLAEVTGPAAVEPAHEARIAAKRVRYLLEPLASAIDGGREVVRELKRLQDALGELHDMDVVSAALAEAIAELAAPTPIVVPNDSFVDARDDVEPTTDRATDASNVVTAELPTAPPAPIPMPVPADATARDPRPGLAGLARRARTRRDALYAELASAWFAGAAAPFLASLERVAQWLSAPPAAPNDAPPREIERKFLLRELPPRVHEVRPLEVEQGWLPGAQLRERLRRTHDGTAERLYRTVKLGAGLSRIELDEETTRELFDAMWPHTHARRIAKRRYRIAEGALVWEIDAFTDRALVLAEVELPSANTASPIPEWLAPFVVREVTEEPAFTNFALAGGAHT